VPPPAAGSAPRPPARVPRPEPRVPLPTPELDSHPHAADVIHGASDPPPPLPSTYPESEIPTRVDGRRRRAPPPAETPSIHAPLSADDAARARATRQWHPPPWLVAVAKWAAPPVMLCLMAGAYWFQAQVALTREQAEALSDVRKKKDADYVLLQQQYAASQAKLGIAQAERDQALAQAEREKKLCSQNALKVVKEDSP